MIIIRIIRSKNGLTSTYQREIIILNYFKVLKNKIIKITNDLFAKLKKLNKKMEDLLWKLKFIRDLTLKTWYV